MRNSEDFVKLTQVASPETGTRTLIKRPESILDHVKIASPCTASWEGMEGGERVRFCGQCSLNVYNLSGMGRAEAERLVEQAEGRLCVRFYRRPDGTMITQDCPVARRAVRQRLAFVLSFVIMSLVSLYSLAARQKRDPLNSLAVLRQNEPGWRAHQPEPIRGLLHRIDPQSQPPMGMVAPPPQPITGGMVPLQTMGEVAVQQPTMGKVAVRPKPPVGNATEAKE